MFARIKLSTSSMASMVVLVSLSLLVCTIQCNDQLEGTGADDQQQQQQVHLPSGRASLISRHNSRILAVPQSLARYFLFYNAGRQAGAIQAAQQQQQQRQQQQQQLLASSSGNAANRGQSELNGGYERTSRGLDPIATQTFGKRSVDPTESFANFEPTFSHQNFIKWAPVDAPMDNSNAYNRDY